VALSAVQVSAEATAVLEGGGYQRFDAPEAWPATARVFEDPFGIVSLHVYETWQQLIDGWADAQGLLVDLISASVSREEPKAWEGYLVLFTVGRLLDADRQQMVELRYDTNRVRKLVAASEDLDSLADVKTALLPLLPLQLDYPELDEGGLLTRLPELLMQRGIDRDVTETAVRAFSQNESILQSLNLLRRADET
jgi:hypothetical protein